jgi:DNA-binding IclR family transcriptional regulator
MMSDLDLDLATLLTRARSEYNEMPGLRLAAAQAARLWATDRSTSQRVLDDLVRAGFLWRTRDGHYLRPSEACAW